MILEWVQYSLVKMFRSSFERLEAHKIQEARCQITQLLERELHDKVYTNKASVSDGSGAQNAAMTGRACKRSTGGCRGDDTRK
jgi:hypothetical protein